MRYTKKIHALVNKRCHKRLLAANPKHSDLYLVEYPKSGITWFSTILANIALSESNRKEIATFTSARLYIPDIHLDRNLSDPIYHRPPVRMIKSHAHYNPYYNFVVYLCREPYSVMKSYYRYLHAHSQRMNSFESFCFEDDRGIKGWKNHVNSWLDGNITGKPIHVIRYEDLLQEPLPTVMALSDNFGWNFDRSSVTDALEKSNINRMGSQEKLYSFHNPRHTMKFIGNNELEIQFKEYKEEINHTCEKERVLLRYAKEN